MKIETIYKLLNSNPNTIKEYLTEKLDIDYKTYMAEYQNESHKIGFIKFFTYELNKIGDITFTLRKNIIRKVFGVKLSRLLVYISDYEVRQFFDKKELLYTTFEEKISRRFLEYNNHTVQTMAAMSAGKKRTIGAVQNKVYDLLTAQLDTQQHLLIYYRKLLLPLMNHNLTLLSKTDSGLVSELPLFDRATYTKNQTQINTVLNELKRYIDPAAVSKYSSILGIPFHVFGDNEESDLTPTVLMDTIHKALEEQAKKTEDFLKAPNPNLPNIVDDLNTDHLNTEKQIANELELEPPEKIITADAMKKVEGHRSLYDERPYVEDEVEFTDYEVEEVKEEAVPKEDLNLPTGDFLKPEKEDDDFEDMLY